MERELHCLPMARTLLNPLPAVSLPDGCFILSVDESNGALWESVMEDAYDEVFLPGTFRGVMVNHPGYRDGQVFVMTNGQGQPIATASGWPLEGSWHRADDRGGSVIHVGVIHSHRGKRLAEQMVYHVLQDLRKRGCKFAELGVEERNYPAIRTYLRCGFAPMMDDPVEAEYWQEQFHALSLPRYEMEIPLLPKAVDQLPPRPWPHLMQAYAKAERDRQPYVYGQWYWHHLFHVASGHFINLKPLLLRSAFAAEWMNAMESKAVLNVFVDRPVLPQAALAELRDGTLYLIGECSDPRFINGVHEYVHYRCKPKFEKLGMSVHLLDADFTGPHPCPRIVKGLTYSVPMVIPID